MPFVSWKALGISCHALGTIGKPLGPLVMLLVLLESPLGPLVVLLEPLKNPRRVSMQGVGFIMFQPTMKKLLSISQKQN